MTKEDGGACLRPPLGDAGGRPMVISPAAPHGPEALVIASLTAAEVVDEEAALPEGVAGAAVLHLHGCNWAASVGPVSRPETWRQGLGSGGEQ